MSVKIKIRAVPNAPKSECAGEYGDALKIKLAAPALDGKANVELVKFISKKLKISKGNIQIACGETSRDKLVEIFDCPRAREMLLE